MDTLLSFKHWQLLGILFLYWFFLVIILNSIGLRTPWVLDIFLFNVIPIFGYPLLLTHALDKHLKLSNGKVPMGLKTYDVFWLLFVTVVLFSEWLFDREGLTATNE